MQVNKYFNIKELVSRDTYEKHGNNSIKFLDKIALEALENVREILNVPLTCNNWATGGTRNQCGYRGEDNTIGANQSAHKEGKAFDLISPRMSAKEMWDILERNQHRIKHPIRIEKWDSSGKEITWLHIDTKPFNNKLYFFRA